MDENMNLLYDDMKKRLEYHGICLIQCTANPDFPVFVDEKKFKENKLIDKTVPKFKPAEFVKFIETESSSEHSNSNNDDRQISEILKTLEELRKELANIVHRTINNFKDVYSASVKKFRDDYANGGSNDEKDFFNKIEALARAIGRKNLPANAIPDRKKEITSIKDELIKKANESLMDLGISTTYNHIAPDSNIMKLQEAHFLGNALKKLDLAQKGCAQLIFDAAKFNFSAQEFHKKCDYKGSTFVFVRTVTGKRFGGFTYSKWTSGENLVDDKKCFLFSLDRKEVYDCKISQGSIESSSRYGPTFGKGPDLFLCNGCNKMCLSTMKPESFEFNNVRIEDIAGSSSFFVENYEVWKIDF